MPIVLFRSRIKEDADTAALEALGAQMDTLVRTQRGFVSYRDYTAADGEVLTLVEFRDEASLKAWRHHPEHRTAQQRGRDEFFSEYRIQVCEVLREYAFQPVDPRKRS